MMTSWERLWSTCGLRARSGNPIYTEIEHPYLWRYIFMHHFTMTLWSIFYGASIRIVHTNAQLLVSTTLFVGNNFDKIRRIMILCLALKWGKRQKKRPHLNQLPWTRIECKTLKIAAAAWICRSDVEKGGMHNQTIIYISIYAWRTIYYQLVNISTGTNGDHHQGSYGPRHQKVAHSIIICANKWYMWKWINMQI